MLTLSLPPDVESRLNAKAEAAGADVSTYAARLIQAAVQRPDLDELLKVVRAEFAASGMSEAEAAERYEQEKHAVRQARQGRPLDE